LWTSASPKPKDSSMAQEPERFSRETFQAWLGHPVNRPYRQWLLDQREALAQAWAAGVAMDQRQQCKALLLGELAAPEWADVAQFYDIEESDPQ
jgi:hypothetical protein